MLGAPERALGNLILKLKPDTAPLSG